MKREACRICGRWGSNDPTQTCNQTQDVSGEYECRGDAPWSEDAEGFFVYPTEAELAEMAVSTDAMIAESKPAAMDGEGRNG